MDQFWDIVQENIFYKNLILTQHIKNALAKISDWPIFWKYIFK